ncbi:hypothetical protein D623_10005671 [Myotis brandtii]|uniref:Uncharacterized protein n=1 Tax=Myotis brandtii TaxID=109478 RepID=S7MI99_MYOBR|nr:hypothetical protein D623_10005671 [Myotis brandtii]
MEREALLPIQVEQRQERDNHQDGHAHIHSSLSSRTHQLFLFPKTFASQVGRTLHSPFSEYVALGLSEITTWQTEDRKYGLGVLRRVF